MRATLWHRLGNLPRQDTDGEYTALGRRTYLETKAFGRLNGYPTGHRCSWRCRRSCVIGSTFIEGKVMTTNTLPWMTRPSRRRWWLANLNDLPVSYNGTGGATETIEASQQGLRKVHRRRIHRREIVAGLGEIDELPNSTLNHMPRCETCPGDMSPNLTCQPHSHHPASTLASSASTVSRRKCCTAIAFSSSALSVSPSPFNTT